MPCGVSGNAIRVCSNSACVITSCAPGFDDCNGDPQDGCEIDLNLSPANCGQCGRVCMGQSMCLGGGCCAPTLPPGSYQSTCIDCEACDGVLRCRCNDAAQMLQNTSLPLFPPCGNITNCNGALQCNGC